MANKSWQLAIFSWQILIPANQLNENIISASVAKKGKQYSVISNRFSHQHCITASQLIRESVAKKSITFDDFQKVEIRTGRIISVEEFPEARNPSYKLLVDLGDEVGIKKSIAQLTVHYKPEDLQGKMVLCVVNFPPRQIGKSVSEVLTLGVPDQNNACALVVPDKDVPAGGRLY